MPLDAVESLPNVLTLSCWTDGVIVSEGSGAGASGVFFAWPANSFCRFCRKAVFALTFAAVKAWEASDRTSPAAPSVKSAACSLGASSLGFCRFLCRWRSARIGRCFAGAFAMPFRRGAFSLVFNLSFSSRCRISSIVNTSQMECRPNLGNVIKLRISQKRVRYYPVPGSFFGGISTFFKKYEKVLDKAAILCGQVLK